MAELRLATVRDVAEIDGLMRASIAAIFPSVYHERQTASSVIHIGSVDPMLVDDGTYFVIDADGELEACGGWSRRDKLYTGSGDRRDDGRLLDPLTEAARVRAMFVRGDRTRRGLGMRILDACAGAARAEGFTRLALMATLPGLRLYERFGFRVVEHVGIPLPDGVTIAGAAMEMSLDP